MFATSIEYIQTKILYLIIQDDSIPIVKQNDSILKLKQNDRKNYKKIVKHAQDDSKITSW